MQLLTKYKKILYMGFRAALKFSKNQPSLERLERGLVPCLGCALRFAQEASTVACSAGVFFKARDHNFAAILTWDK